MKKMSTLFKKDPENLGRVINEVNPENSWVFTDDGVKATRKFDGTSCAIIKGALYKRYDAKLDEKTSEMPGEHYVLTKKPIPDNAIACCEPDLKSGHWPHWVPCDRDNPADKYHWEAFDRLIPDHFGVDLVTGELDEYQDTSEIDGTYELCGPKIQGNPEGFEEHTLIQHGSEIVTKNGWFMVDFQHDSFIPFEMAKIFLSENDIEGIVFHHPDGRMCKLRKTDFGLKRGN